MTTALSLFYTWMAEAGLYHYFYGAAMNSSQRATINRLWRKALREGM
jgi:hypothetical protein